MVKQQQVRHVGRYPLLGKWKVSQNQPAANQASLIAALEKAGDPMAGLIRQHRQ